MSFTTYLCIFSFISVGLVGCSHTTKYLTAPTKADLIANSYQNGLSQEIDLDYQLAYKNLRQAYTYCIAYTNGEDMVFTDNTFTPDLEMGILTARSGEGDYLYQMNVEKLRNEKTQLTLFLPHNFKGAEIRFEQDIQRALGKDPKCNR